MPRVLVIGANGMLGHALLRRLGKALDVNATARQSWQADPRLQSVVPEDRLIGGCDITDEEALKSALAQVRPNVVVNCAGVIKQRAEAENVEMQIAVNALAPHRLARLCDKSGAKLIHLSTDCVFSGSRGNYNEEDIPDPIDIYGHSKLLGEIVQFPHLTLRTSMVGWQLSGSEGLANWFLSQSGRSASGWTRAIFSGLTTYALSDVILNIIICKNSLSGLYHVAADPISKHDLLYMLNYHAKCDVELIKTDGLTIDRSLDGRKFAEATGIRVPSWPDMLSEMAARRFDYE